MNYTNGINSLWLLTSEYHGPTILNFAGNGEGEEEAEEEEEEKSEESEESEDEAEAEEETEEETKEDEDPLKTPNPFEEGSSQHGAFEQQREKFKKKLEQETEKARKEAGAEALSGKLDEVLKIVGKAAETNGGKKSDPDKKKPSVKATEEEIAIVNDALRAQGIDPQQLARERRRQEVLNAFAELRKEYPNAQFEESDVIKFANDEGIPQRMPGATMHDILEFALSRKLKGALYSAPAKKDEKQEGKSVKKETVKIEGSGTKKTPVIEGEKPKGFAAWKQKILGKHAGK